MSVNPRPEYEEKNAILIEVIAILTMFVTPSAHAIQGSTFQVVVEKSNSEFAFATHRIFPLDEFGNRVDISHIVSISIPVNSQILSRPYFDDVWSVTSPFSLTSGIGIIVNPTIVMGNDENDFALHQNEFLGVSGSPPYVASYTPDPTEAVVTYVFDNPMIITGVDIAQHVNGITKIGGRLGNDINALTSLGSVFGPSGDVEDVFVVPAGDEGVIQRFLFNTAVGVPDITSTGVLFVVSLVSMVFARRRNSSSPGSKSSAQMTGLRGA